MKRTQTYAWYRSGRVSVRVRRRSLVVSVALLFLIAVCGCVALMVGDYPLTVTQTLAALAGGGDDPLARYFVRDLRLPRVLCAVLVGGCLGIAGEIFQSLTRNPLGSPDVTGFTVGAASGALLQILVFGGGPVAVSAGAVLGGFATGAVVYVLSRRQGVQSMTFVLVGLGLSFVLQALNSLLVVKADLSAAQQAAFWLAGSLNGSSWSQVVYVGFVMAVLLPIVGLLGRDLSVMLAGDDIACGVGVEVPRRRVQFIALGVMLTAVAVSVAGPVGFVALAAPQLAHKVSRASDAALGNAALMGAAVLLAADLAAQRLFAPVQLPVGAVTGVLGGAYLMWLVAREWKGDK